VGGDLGSPDETYLSSLYDRPVMVHRYPASVKASTWSRSQHPELALCVDVLAPKATAKSSADRSACLARLAPPAHSRAQSARGSLQVVSRSPQVRSVPTRLRHGIERAVAWICGLEHVRETIPFPRMLHRLYPDDCVKHLPRSKEKPPNAERRLCALVSAPHFTCTFPVPSVKLATDAET